MQEGLPPIGAGGGTPYISIASRFFKILLVLMVLSGPLSGFNNNINIMYAKRITKHSIA